MTIENKGGIDLISIERQRQIDVEGWTAEHDDQHDGEQLATAGACYAFPARHRKHFHLIPRIWPWHKEWWKPTPDDRVRELVKAGALIAAEIDRLQNS